MKFNVIDGAYADFDSIHDDFVEDYVFSVELSNNEIRNKYNLTHGEFRELCNIVKKEHGLSRRNTLCKNAKYYYKCGCRFIIQKRINQIDTYFGSVPTEDIARKLVELCKNLEWNVDVCREICKNWREYIV